MAIKKPSDFFAKESEDNTESVEDKLSISLSKKESLHSEINRVQSLSEQVNQLQKELSEKIVQTDLEKIVLTQINTMQNNFKNLQEQLKESNEEDIFEIRGVVSELSESLTNLLEYEFPKHRKQNTKTRHRIVEEINEFKQTVNESHQILRQEIEGIVEGIDNNLESFSQQIEESAEEVKRTSKTYTNLSKILEKKIEDEKVVIEQLNSFKEGISSEIAEIKSDVAVNEQHLKTFNDTFEEYDTILENVDKYIQKNHQELVQLKEEVYSEIEKLSGDTIEQNLERLERKIDYIRETYSKIEPEVLVKEVITEGLLNEPPEVKNADPLTPLDKNFVTLEQLQQHYRLFINRIQQQIATLGGGGETRLEFLDDIDRVTAKVDGKVLKYDGTLKKWVGADGGGGNVGIASYALVAGIATYSATSGVTTALQTAQNFSITGNFVTAPIISFDGTSAVALAATLTPKSVGLGTYTTGNYVKSISGTANQITVTGGTGEGSNSVLSFAPNPTIPGNVTIANDLQVNNNLNVTGNITIGGTSAYIISNDFRVKDADIVLGFTTDSYGNDASNDTTANHGGIAIASTEGTPLVQLFNPAIGETNPATYKKIMWFKSGSFAGLNTDAWLINYGVGIGSTQFPAGTRLAAGAVQITERDLAVVRNVNSSGIVTANTFRPSSGYIQAADGTNSFYIYSGTGNVAFQGTIGASQINSASGNKVVTLSVSDAIFENNVRVTGVTSSTGGFIGNLTGTATTATTAGYAITSGISTVAQGLTGTPNLVVGIVTATRFVGGASSITSLNVSGVSTFASVYSLRQTVSPVSNVYTLDVTSANEFLSSSAFTGVTTVNLSNISSIPTNYVWRGVLRFQFTSGSISWFGGNVGVGYTVKWDGNSAMTPTANEQEAVIIEIVGAGTTIEVAALRGRT